MVFLEKHSIITGTITYAIRGRDILRRQGYSANMEKTKQSLTHGCGYSITVSGDIELSEEQQKPLFACLEGGKTKSPAETAESGGDGPWVYIYYESDAKKQLEFIFASHEKEAEFERLCAEYSAAD